MQRQEELDASNMIDDPKHHHEDPTAGTDEHKLSAIEYPGHNGKMLRKLDA
jgi:hypothetical protein